MKKLKLWMIFLLFSLLPSILITPFLTSFIFSTISALRIISIFVCVFGLSIFFVICFFGERVNSETIDRVPWLKKAVNCIRQIAFRPILNQTLVMWLAFGLVSTGISYVVVKSLSLDGQIQKPGWLSIGVDTEAQELPDISVSAGNQGESLKLLFQPYPTTHLGVQRIDGAGVIRIGTIRVDEEIVPNELISIYGEHKITPEGIEITDPSGVLLGLNTPAKNIEVGMRGEDGSARLLLNDQTTIVNLDSDVERFGLVSITGDYQGWALLPPEKMDSVTISIQNQAKSFSINQIAIWGDESLLFQGEELNRITSLSAGCDLSYQGESLTIIQSDPSEPCKLVLFFDSPLNDISLILRWAIVILLSIFLLAILWFIRSCLHKLNKHANSSWLKNVLDEAVNRLSKPSTSWKVTTREIMLWLFLFCAVFHVLYALLAPWQYNMDSEVYYWSGVRILDNQDIMKLGARSPGYPGMIGFLISLFGHNVNWIILTQHLLLATLAPLGYWALKNNMGKVPALFASVLMGISPIISTAANTVMTESVFSFFCAAAFLVYIKSKSDNRYLFISAILFGIVVLIRPNGLIIGLIIVGFELLSGWIKRKDEQLNHLTTAALFSCTILFFLAPWLMLVWKQEHSLDISRGLSRVGAWTNFVAEGLITPDMEINRPDRAIWYFPTAWDYNPFEIYYSDFSPVADAWTDWADVYYSEGIRAGIENDFARYKDIVFASLKYNFTFRWNQFADGEGYSVLGGTGDGKYLYFPYLTYFSSYNHAASITDLSDENIINQIHIEKMTFHWVSDSPVKKFITGIGLLGIKFWWVISLLSFLSIPFLIVHKHLQGLLPFILSWLFSIASYSLMGYAADRYIAVFEPLLVCLSVYFVTFILNVILSLPEMLSIRKHG